MGQNGILSLLEDHYHQELHTCIFISFPFFPFNLVLGFYLKYCGKGRSQKAWILVLFTNYVTNEPLKGAFYHHQVEVVSRLLS
jgi:hypothetical protein